jgi:hypothetical protein
MFSRFRRDTQRLERGQRHSAPIPGNGPVPARIAGTDLDTSDPSPQAGAPVVPVPIVLRNSRLTSREGQALRLPCNAGFQ